MRHLPLLLLSALAGCAYTFNPSLPVHIKTLQIPVVENETLEPTLSRELTDALSERFIADNKLNVVSDNADAVLEGEIVEYQDRVFGFDNRQTADEYIVVMKVRMRLRDRVKNKDVWQEDGIQGRASYFVRGEGSGETLTSEEEARVVVIEQIVDVVLSKTVEGW